MRIKVRLPLPVSYCVVDVEGAVLVASGDVVREQRVAPAVCIPRLNPGHRGVDGCAFAHTGVAWQIQEHRVVVVDVPDINSHHNLKKIRLCHANLLNKTLDIKGRCASRWCQQINCRIYGLRREKKRTRHGEEECTMTLLKLLAAL